MAAMIRYEAFPYSLKSLKCHPAVYYSVKAILCIAFSFMWVYGIIPMMGIWYSFKALIYPNVAMENAKIIPGFKLFEQLGEAIPQFLIGAVFFYNYHTQLPQSDLHFFWVSISLSFGSIMYGVIDGIISRGKCMDWFKHDEHDNENELAIERAQRA